MDKFIVVDIILLIVGIPIFLFFVRYIKLRYNYFKRRKNNLSLLVNTFTPKFVMGDNSEEAQMVNLQTKWFWMLIILYGIFMMMIVKYIIFE